MMFDVGTFGSTESGFLKWDVVSGEWERRCQCNGAGMNDESACHDF